MADFSKIMEKKAAALKYDNEKNGAPMIVAAGMGHMAEKITETAMKSGVPVYEDDSLASLLTQMKLGAEIPEELFQAIVEIYIYFLGFTGDPVKDRAERERRREERKNNLSSYFLNKRSNHEGQFFAFFGKWDSSLRTMTFFRVF